MFPEWILIFTLHENMKFSIKHLFSKCDQTRSKNPSLKTSFFVQCYVISTIYIIIIIIIIILCY